MARCLVKQKDNFIFHLFFYTVLLIKIANTAYSYVQTKYQFSDYLILWILHFVQGESFILILLLFQLYAWIQRANRSPDIHNKSSQPWSCSYSHFYYSEQNSTGILTLLEEATMGSNAWIQNNSRSFTCSISLWYAARNASPNYNKRLWGFVVVQRQQPPSYQDGNSVHDTRKPVTFLESPGISISLHNSD
jgi:hypothetical protein